ncbi:Oligomerization domain-containing protein [Linnemannia elongata]|nr:Oligomerization domain-containing protein [Linnemannia elongata]
MLSTLIRNAGASTARRTTRCLNSHHSLTTRRLLASTPSSSTSNLLLITPRTVPLSPAPFTHIFRTSGQKAYLTTTPSHLRQYEKHHDHINVKKPTTSSTTSSNNTAAAHRGKAASVADQDLDDHHVQQTIDSVDLDTAAELKRRHSSHDTAALLDKDELGLQQDEVIVTSTTTTTSVLLEDKLRSEEEFSWFVDKTYSTTTTSTSEDHDDKVSSQDFVPLWKRNARGQHHKHSKHHHSKPATTSPNKHDIADDLKDAPVAIRGLVRMLEHERARHVTVMDMRQKCDWTDWMVIAEGLSERHVGNVADEVYTALKKMLPKTSPPLMEGRSTPDWVVIDTGSIILHFMTHETRKERNLEGLWGAVKDPLKLKDASEISWEDVQKKLTESWMEDPGRSKGAEHGSKRGRRGEEDLSLDEVVKG